MFSCRDTFNRRQYLNCNYLISSSYWNSSLPNKCELTTEQRQVMYRKLVTMSKSLLRKNPHQHINHQNASLCFCPDCIADRQVPLRFKLQFLEEQAEEKEKQKLKQYKNKYARNNKNSNSVIINYTLSVYLSLIHSLSLSHSF